MMIFTIIAYFFLISICISDCASGQRCCYQTTRPYTLGICVERGSDCPEFLVPTHQSNCREPRNCFGKPVWEMEKCVSKCLTRCGKECESVSFCENRCCLKYESDKKSHLSS